MIRISLGNVGSGKTLCEVREMYLNQSRVKTYTNINTSLKTNVKITADMLIKKEVVGTKKNRSSGEETPIIKYALNTAFWRKQKRPLNFVLDEAHTLVNPRRSHSHLNIIMTDFVSLARRITQDPVKGEGELVFISQLWNKIDINIRDLATQIRYHKCYYLVRCDNCKYVRGENTEIPDDLKMRQCPKCGNYLLIKYNFNIEVWHFRNIMNYLDWTNFGTQTFYRHYIIKDADHWFDKYDTLQWEDLLSGYMK